MYFSGSKQDTPQITNPRDRQPPCMAPVRLSALDWLCFALLIIGAINWGIIGIAEINVVETVLDPVFQAAAAEIVIRTFYVLVGLAGLYFFYPLYRVSRQADGQASTTSTRD